MNRLKGLDVADRVSDRTPWTEVWNIVQKAVTKTILQKKKCKKAKWLSEVTLQIPEEKRETKAKERKEKIYFIERRIPEKS